MLFLIENKINYQSTWKMDPVFAKKNIYFFTHSKINTFKIYFRFVYENHDYTLGNLELLENESAGRKFLKI